jgi:putative membrane protein
MRRQFAIFIIRWLLNSFGLWVAVRLLGTGISDHQVDESFGLFLLAGLVLSLPAILLTLGLFIIIVNGLMVWLALQVTPGLHMTFLNSIFAGMFLSLINYIVSSAVELRTIKKKEEA